MQHYQDNLYPDAVLLVREAKSARLSLLQQHFRIGYNRAVKLVDELEQHGVVSPFNAQGMREILPFTAAEPVKIQECSKRRCKWRGTKDEMDTKPAYEGLGKTFICPRCGCEDFYIISS